MKLQNKKTGSVGYLQNDTSAKRLRVINGNNDTVGEYNSLAELNAEWEDVTEEKPKRINEVDIVLDAIGEYCEEHSYYSGGLEKIKILNAVEEKLRAWKRLKDKGFRFTGYSHYDWNGDKSPAIAFEYSDFDKMFDDKQVAADLDLLFGGEE